MASFNDAAGRTWNIEVRVGLLKRVRELAKVDLLQVLDDQAALLGRLGSDACLLVDVLYACCKEQADGLGITDEQFGQAMHGDALEHATVALLEGLADFFPKARGDLLRRMMAAGASLDLRIRRQIDASLDRMMAEPATADEPPPAGGPSLSLPDSAG